MDSVKRWAMGVCLGFVFTMPVAASPITYAFSTDAGYDGQLSYDAELGISSLSFQAPIHAGGSLPLDVSWTYLNQPALTGHSDVVLGARYSYHRDTYNDLAHWFTGPKFWADGTLVRSYESVSIRLTSVMNPLVAGDGTIVQGLTAADIGPDSAISFMVDSVDPYSFAYAHQDPSCPATLDFAECPDSAFSYWDTYITVYHIVSLQQVPEPRPTMMLLVAVSMLLLRRSAQLAACNSTKCR